MKNFALSIIAVLFVVQCSQSDVEWTKHGLSDAEERFSQLQDINESNVSKLGLAWSFDTNTNRGHETTPIVVDRTCSIYNNGSGFMSSVGIGIKRPSQP